MCEAESSATSLPSDPRIAIAILSERLKGMSKQVDKIDRTVEDVFDVLNGLRSSLNELSVQTAAKTGCPNPGLCAELKAEVTKHSNLIHRLDGARMATLGICSIVAFAAGITSPYILRVIFQ